MAYNDEPPESTYSANCGHTKGVLVADDQSGFWMIHSVPKFPNITSSLSLKHIPMGKILNFNSRRSLRLRISTDRPQVRPEFPVHLGQGRSGGRNRTAADLQRTGHLCIPNIR